MEIHTGVWDEASRQTWHSQDSASMSGSRPSRFIACSSSICTVGLPWVPLEINNNEWYSVEE